MCKFLISLLLWESIFLFLLVLTFWSFIISTQNLLTLIIHSEFIILVFFCLLLYIGIYFNINLLFALAYLFLILGGLELALNILLLLL